MRRQESVNTRGGSLKTVGQVLMGLRQFTIARAPGGIEYAVLQDTSSTARLFMSPAGGTKGRENANSTIQTWFEWCPGTPTSSVDGGPVSNWLSTGVGNGDETPCAPPFISTATPLLNNDLVWPTIAVDGRGNIAVTDIEDVNPRTINYAVRGITNPQRPGALVQGPTFMSSTPFTLATGGFHRPMGDYGWLAVLPQGPMFRPPGCSVTNDFFPLWTAADSTGNPIIITRGFSLTPP